MHKKRLAIVGAILVLAVVIASTIVYFNFFKNPYSGNLQSVSIGLIGNEVDSLIYLADNQQYFASNGLNLTIKNYISGLASVNALLSGEVNIGVAAEFVLVPKILNDEKVWVIGTIDKFLNQYVVARTDKGITNIMDLDGKTIGASLGTSAEFYLARFLELNGISISQVSIVDVSPPQTPYALANGTVDAVIAWQPNMNVIENLIGDKIIVWPAQANQLGYRAVVCTNEWAANNPELIKRFLISLAQAESYVMSNPEESKLIIKNLLNYADDYISEVWDEHQFSLSLDQSLLLAMQDEAQWMISSNLTNATSIPNFLNYIYLDGLEAVKPNSVTIIK